VCGIGRGGKALESEISRRAVLVGAAAAAGGVALAGLASPRVADADVAVDPLLSGVVDFHVHSDPERSDFFARSLNDFEVAHKFAEVGARAVVLKNHYLITSDRAWLAREIVPNIQLFGGVALNLPVGGLNPAAIVTMARMKGGYGKVVWFPTFDGETHLKRFPRPDATPVPVVDADGELLPAARDCLKVIVDENLVLCSGHLSVAETLTLFRAARDLGVTRMLVTHALTDPARFSVSQMQEVVSLGGLMEHVYAGVLQGPNSLVPGLRAWTNIPIATYVDAIRQVGGQNFVLSTDLGQAENPIHPMGYKVFIMELMQAGISADEIDVMARRNPAGLLGLSGSA
jgi:hypothetical protein